MNTRDLSFECKSIASAFSQPYRCYKCPTYNTNCKVPTITLKSEEMWTAQKFTTFNELFKCVDVVETFTSVPYDISHISNLCYEYD